MDRDYGILKRKAFRISHMGNIYMNDLVEYLEKQYGSIDHLKFKDHHAYSVADAERINERARGKIIVTTEKDYAKLEKVLDNNSLYCLRIELDFVFKEEQQFFEKMIKGL